MIYCPGGWMGGSGTEEGAGKGGGTARKAGEGTAGVSHHAPIRFFKPPQGKNAFAAAPM